MSRQVAGALLTMLLLVAAPPAADACKCSGPVPACQATWESSAVFVARVVQLERTADQDVIEFDVLEAFRGVQPGRLDMTVRLGTCAQRFEEGRDYLVYASGSPNSLTTSICSGNQLAERAADDLAYLRGLAELQPRTLGDLRGVVQVVNADGSKSPLPGRLVTITGTGTTRVVRTGPDGRYSARLPVDTYVLSIPPEEQLTPIGAIFSAQLRDARGCAVGDVSLERPPGRR